MFEPNHASFSSAAATSTTSLAELMSAFSYALDLTEGQPQGHSVRSCWIASRLAVAIGLSPAEQRIVYYATMLKDLGCSSNSARIAEVYLTDDRRFKHDFKLVPQGLGPVLKFVFAKTGVGRPLATRAKAVANILRNGPEIARSLIETRCTQGADIARMLRFPEDVALAIAALDEHWDGGGKPYGLAGEAIPRAARMALLAQIVDVFFMNDGPAAAIDEVTRHRGTWFEPELCDALLVLMADTTFWAELASADIDERVLGEEPAAGQVAVDEDYLDDIALAFGRVIDAKSPYTAGHSERVGIYCDALAAHIGIDPAERRSLRRAAMLHDVGKLGVSSAVLEKPGKLDDREWVEMRGHAAHTTEILGRIGPFRELAMVAGSHHERLDGKGYPLGLNAMTIATEARIITVCDFFDALTADRPYRSAMPTEQALEIMAGEVGNAIDPHCFAALRELVAQGLGQIVLPKTPASLNS